MGSLSDFAENELMDHIFNVAYSPIATIYLALCTAAVTDAHTGATMTECANANAYTRKAITFAAASGRAIAQTGDVTFDQASGSWGTVSHWAIMDGNTWGADDILAYGAFGTAKAVGSGNTPSVASGEITVSFDAGTTDGISNAVVVKLLDLMFRNTAYAKPDTFIALTTATIADTNTGSTITEHSGDAYARKEVDINGGTPPTWTISSAGALDNVAAITFAEASASWGTIVAAAVCSAVTAGDLLFYDNGVADTAVGANDTVEFAIGAFDVAMT